MYKFLKRFVDETGNTMFPEILDVDPTLTPIPWLSIPDTIIEPDNWELFWKLWNDFKTSANNLLDIWDLLYIYVNNDLTSDQIAGHPGPILPKQYQDWTPYFPKMFQKIFDIMPFSRIDKISIAMNTEKVPLHIDSRKLFYPWPNSLRVMIWDTNDRPTFYLTEWPEFSYDNDILRSHSPKLNQTYFNIDVNDHDKYYVNLPKTSNTFLFSNGPFVHGADLEKPKLILIVWGNPDPIPWKKKLYQIINIK